MPFKIVMPKFTETMEEGTIVKWYKREGDLVSEGEPIVEVVGDKLTCDIEAPAQGKLLRILQTENSNVSVGQIIALIGREGEAANVEAEPKDSVSQTELRETGRRIDARPRIPASPLAKKLAREHGVDLTQIQSSSPGGRIAEADVRRYLESRPAARFRDEEKNRGKPLTGVRKTIAERMTLSAHTPRITLVVEASANGLMELQRHYESKGVTVTPTDIIVKSVAKALKAHPGINSTFEGDQVKVLQHVNVGVAVDTDYGLVVPVVKDVQSKPVSEVAEEVRRIVERARSNALTQEDVSDGTFTVTNLGMFGVDAFTPLINPPQCAILGVGKITDRPVAIEGRVMSKPTVPLCLSFDHRIVDGAPAAKFLQTVKEILEDAQTHFSDS